MIEKTNFIKSLLSIGAIKLNIDEPFTWSSGWKSPIYCDNRLALSYLGIRQFIVQELTELANIYYPTSNVIAGVATAGIPHASFVAYELNLPMIYVRSKAKEYGLKNQIEGRLESKQQVLVIEDLISSGKSSLNVVDAVRNAEAEVSGVLGIFSYNFPEADKSFRKADVTYKTIVGWEDLLQALEEADMIGEKKTRILEEWREDPSNWRQD